jgi:nitrite reductase/ring-hydroxylating ferredoxin subunit
VAGSAELSVGTPAQLRLQRARPGAQHRHQRAERRLARTPRSSPAGVADEWSARYHGGAGRAQSASGPAGYRGPRRITVCFPRARRRNRGERRLGHHRRHRLAAHPRGGPPSGAGAWRGQHAGHSAVRAILVGPAPRAPRPRDRPDRAGLRSHGRRQLPRRRLGVRLRHRNRPVGSAAAHYRVDGKPVRVEVDGVGLVVCQTKPGEVSAFGEFCPHLAAPMADGWLDRGRIVCPWHGSWFAAESGRVLRGPSAAPLPCYEARLVNGMVEVRGEEQQPAAGAARRSEKGIAK